MVSNLDELYCDVEKLDCLVVNGGGYFNSLWSLPHRLPKLFSILVPVYIALDIGKKIVFSANGFGPFVDSSLFFERIFKDLEGVTFNCREKILSPSVLRGMGVEEEQLKYLPDDLLFINERLTVNENYGLDIQSNFFVFETYRPVEEIKLDIEKYRNFFLRVKEQSGASPIFIPFYEGRGGGDQAELFESELGVPRLTSNTDSYVAIDRVINLISRAQFVLSDRYHAVVLSLAQGTPCFSVVRPVLGSNEYYYNKIYGLLKEVLGDLEQPYGTYMFNTTDDAFKTLGAELDNKIFSQKTIYSEFADTNLVALREIRESFIQIITGD